MRSLAVASVVSLLVTVKGIAVGQACTAFCTVADDGVLVGNNEDSDNPRTRLWFVAAEPERLGRMYVGYDDLFPQGGMNERGLWFDGFATPRLEAKGEERPAFDGNLIDEAMATCATVDEVIRLMVRHDRAFLENAVLMFADADGDAVSIERNAIIQKTGVHFVQTNFHHSGAVAKPRDRRFVVATEMLERAGNNVSPELVYDVLRATRQRGRYATRYSNIYNLTTRSMRLFAAGDMSRSVTFQLDTELAKGSRVLDIGSLFERSDAVAAAVGQDGQAPRRYRTAATAGSLAILALALGLLGLIAKARYRSSLR